MDRSVKLEAETTYEKIIENSGCVACFRIMAMNGTGMGSGNTRIFRLLPEAAGNL